MGGSVVSVVCVVIGKMILVGLRLLDQRGREFSKTIRSPIKVNLVLSILFSPYKGKQNGRVLLRIQFFFLSNI